MSGGNTRSVLDATTQQLLDAIRDQRGNDRIEWASEPELLVGGFSNKLWRLEITGDDELTGTLVGRVLPDADIALREIAVQTYLARAGFATPAVRLSGAPGQHLEHAWMLMEHVQATPLLADLSGLSALTRLPSLARSIPSRLARCATSLHSYDARPLAESLGTGNDVLDFLSHMRTRMVASKQTELVALANGLLAAPPDSDRIVVCHGDLHPFNVLASAKGDTVIDWTTAQRADPTYDLAFTNLLLTHPPLETPWMLRPIVTRVGRSLGRRFLDSYCEQTNFRIDPDTMNWFTLLGALRILVEISNLRLDGQDDPRSHPFIDMEPALWRLVDESRH